MELVETIESEGFDDPWDLNNGYHSKEKVKEKYVLQKIIDEVKLFQEGKNKSLNLASYSEDLYCIAKNYRDKCSKKSLEEDIAKYRETRELKKELKRNR